MEKISNIAGIGRGDHAAFSEFYRQNRRMLTAYAASILAGDIAAAEDVVDDAFLDIWRSSKNDVKCISEPAWIRRIVRNKAIDWLRKYADIKVDSQTAIDDLGADPHPNPEDLTADISDRLWLQSALNILSVAHRETMFLFYYEEMSLAQIARMMDCPENTVKTRLHYARQALMKQSEVLAF